MSYEIYKFLGSFADPMNFFALLLLLSALATVSPWEGFRGAGRRTSFVLALFLAFLMLCPLGSWALLPLENRYAPPSMKKVDGIIVLTGDENGTLSEKRGLPLAGASAQRHLTMLRLAKRYPTAKIVVVGDPFPLRKSKMAAKDIVAASLESAGIPASRVIYELKSRTTRENAVLAKKLVKPKEDEVWLLVTSAYHMQRAFLSFEKEGWEVVPYPGEYLTYSGDPETFKPDLARQMRFLSRAVHEYVGLGVYWMKGWIERPWR